jgi:hypothetical protein
LGKEKRDYDNQVPDEIASEVVLEDFFPLSMDDPFQVEGGVEVEEDLEHEDVARDCFQE